MKLYIFWILHQTTTLPELITHDPRCISFESYIKPQHILFHPVSVLSCISFESYIKPQLCRNIRFRRICCISFESYIKPQPSPCWDNPTIGCISFESYIKPQQMATSTKNGRVVYLLNPTSNHNCIWRHLQPGKLYIFWILHQTTTYRFESTDFQHITITFSNKKWWVGYKFLCKSTKKTPIE